MKMQVLIVKEKHANDYVICEDHEGINNALIELFEERKAQGCYYTDEELALCRSNQRILRLMYAHADYEYEGFDIEEARVVS